jgi:hypothetical protein
MMAGQIPSLSGEVR